MFSAGQVSLGGFRLGKVVGQQVDDLMLLVHKVGWWFVGSKIGLCLSGQYEGVDVACVWLGGEIVERHYKQNWAQKENRRNNLHLILKEIT